MSEFSYKTLSPGNVRCMIGITGFSHAGKTYSAFRLATGAQRVYGGDIAIIDSEESAGMYAAEFIARHIPLAPPHDAGRWHRAVDFAYNQGARVIILDTLSDEHIAMMERYEEALDRMAGDDWKKRERCSQAAFGKRDVKPLRAKMERRLWDISKSACIIALWRADQKYTPKQKGDANHKPEDDHTWKMSTTSKLMYACTLRWLLRPGSDGVPVPLGEVGNDAERQLVKVPGPLRKLQDAKQLDEQLGEQIARWCKFGDGQTAASKPAPKVGVVKFHRDYKSPDVPPSRVVDDGDPPTIYEYISWLAERPQSDSLLLHAEKVQAIYGRMLQAGAA